MTSPAPDFGRRLAAVAHGLLVDAEVDATLRRSVELTRDQLPGADCVSISLLGKRRRLETPASTHRWADRADELQHSLDQGPGLDAIRHHEFVALQELGTDVTGAYPQWEQAVVADTGIRSSCSVRLRTPQETLGALNVYSTRTRGFSATEQAELQIIAAQIALALNATGQITGLRVGMEGRTVIGQAQGILMERFKISSTVAFDMLSRVSQDTNIRLREVATKLVDTGETPVRG